MRPFDENDLIAYHLNELPLRRRVALERALKVDADLSAQSESIAETLRGFKGHRLFDLDSRLDDGLVEWNWKVLAPALPRYPVAKPTFLRRHLPVLAAAGLAFAAVTVTFVKRHHPPTVLKAVVPQQPSVAPTAGMSRPDALTTARTALNGASEGGRMQQQQVEGLQGAPGKLKDALHPSLLTPASPAPLSEPAQVTASAVASPSLPAALLTAAVPPPTPLLPVLVTSSSDPVEPGQASPAQPVAASVARGKRDIAVHHDHITELTLAMGGTLIPTHYNDVSGVPTSSGATHAVTAIAMFHQQFRPVAGYRITLSYSRPEFFYGYSSPGYINGRMYEAAGTYVVQGPGKGRLSTSVEAGAGVMHITPTIKDPTTGSNMRVAGIVGVAADLMLSKRIGIHAAYRGQVFNGPDFQYSGIGAPINTKILVSNEPSLGITYRFSPR